MPRTTLSDEDYRREIAARVDRIARKARGANSMVLGFEFQEFVCLYESLQLVAQATNGGQKDVKIHRDARVAVDDFKIERSERHRRIQIKAGADVSWERPLVLDFWEDHFAVRDQTIPVSLELCVSSAQLARKLARTRTNPFDQNRPEHRLDFVHVYHVDIGWMALPYAVLEIAMVLDQICLTGFHDDLWANAWAVLRDTFHAARYDGAIDDIIAEAVRPSLHHVRSLKTSLDAEEAAIIAKLNEIPELYFACDGTTLVVTEYEDNCMTLPVFTYDWKAWRGILETNTPTDIDEFGTLMRSRKRHVR